MRRRHQVKPSYKYCSPCAPPSQAPPSTDTAPRCLVGPSDAHATTREHQRDAVIFIIIISIRIPGLLISFLPGHPSLSPESSFDD